jgi:hypothetical protein
MRYRPVTFKQSTSYTGAPMKPRYIPGVRDTKTGELVAYVPLAIELKRALKCANEMADARNRRAA